MEERKKTIFALAKVTIEYEKWFSDGSTGIVKEERLFEYMKDAKCFMWTKYRNAQKELGGQVKEFDENKTEYKYLIGKETVVRAKIEYVGVNHFDADTVNPEHFFNVNIDKKGK